MEPKRCYKVGHDGCVCGVVRTFEIYEATIVR